MKQVMIGRGKVDVCDVSAALVEDGHILVEVVYSLISSGTESSNLERSGQPLIRRAMDQPEQVRQLINYLRSQGLQKTVAKVRGQLGDKPAGYSCAGIVIRAGAGVTGLRPGDWVACAGAGKANHAEIVLVPRDLVVKVPEGCDLKRAASVALGAIAMQGVRRADPRLGEIVAVVGLGLLGQITVQLLKAAGCTVIGLDPSLRRVALAQQLGADYSFSPKDIDVANEVNQRTGGHGVDATIITASSSSDTIVQQAMQITRKKGRVVVVGGVGLGLQRSPLYEKEIDFLISCSYGPGRYDAQYEEQGVDYPYAWVRWTENRNMAEYLHLVGTGRVRLEPILEREYDISRAAEAFAALLVEGERPLGVLLSYRVGEPEARSAKLVTRVAVAPRTIGDRVNIAVVGAGGFAKSVHLPNLQQLQGQYRIRAIVSATGSNAQATAKLFGADYATTNYEDVLADSDVDAIMITTRHNLHAAQTVAALRAGKHVFCEKPLALSVSEMQDILACYDLSLADLSPQALAATALRPVLMVGYNRRFSPAAQIVKQALVERQNPALILYRVNAGYIPPEHWVQTLEGGGRILGEMCHMIDLFSYWVEAPACALAGDALTPHTVHVLRSDNVSATITYADGSVCTLMYTAMGASQLGKEYIEVHVDGKSIIVDDFKSVRFLGGSRRHWTSAAADKGHKQAIEAFGHAVKGGQEWPISLGSLMDTSRISLEFAQAVS